MRACVQCGLSISETATFCQVCGARYDVDAEVATLEATQVVQGPPADAVSAGGADRWAEAQPYEPGAELVADLADAPRTAGASDLDDRGQAPGAPGLEAGAKAAEAAAEAAAAVEPVTDEEAAEASDAAADDGAAADEDAGAVDGPAADEDAAAVDGAAAAESAVGVQDRKLAAVRVLLEAAAGCEDADVSRAAALYQEAILGCLELADESGDLATAEGELLGGFDGLSCLLQRRGLSEEALAVVDDATALGLLDGGKGGGGGHCDALLARREDLRRLLFVDSAQL